MTGTRDRGIWPCQCKCPEHAQLPGLTGLRCHGSLGILCLRSQLWLMFKCTGQIGFWKTASSCRVSSVETMILQRKKSRILKPASLRPCLLPGTGCPLESLHPPTFCLGQNCPRPTSIHSQPKRAQSLGDLVISAEHVSLM